jgi:plastocyanin
MYRPSTIEIKAGEAVEWQNEGQVSNSVTDDPARANNPGDALLPAGVQPFNSGNVMPGGRFRHTFAQPGRYRYFCLTHEGDRMIGEVIVSPATPSRSGLMANVNRRANPSGATAMPFMTVKMHDEEPMYRPSSVRIVSGQTVEWKNQGRESHSVSDDPNKAWDPVDALRPPGVRPFSSGAILPGGRFRHTFTEPGRYRYFDRSHETDKMVGEVIVQPAANGEAASQSNSNGDGLSAASVPAITE